MRRLRITVVAFAVALTFGAPARGHAAAATPLCAPSPYGELTALSDCLAGALDVPWPQLLPPLPVSTGAQPHAVPFCARPSLDCVQTAFDRLAAARTQLGCDHRAIFATTYALLTGTLLDTMRQDTTFFHDSAWLEAVDAEFVNFYARSLDASRNGGAVPEAWRIAFDTARSGSANAGQDLLLGINAHVQADMAFVEAEMGLRRPDGTSRKADHDAFNVVLQRAYERIVQTLAAQYDPLLTTTNAGWDPADNIAGLELVKEWREVVWRNAERLLDAQSPRAYAQVAVSIQANAAAWARLIAAPQQAGYGAQRDAWCSTHLGPLPH